MENFLRQKYAYPKFRNFLLSTGDEYLIEGNFWHDNFWGDCRCRKCKDKEGENRLGLLTMKVRDSL